MAPERRVAQEVARLSQLLTQSAERVAFQDKLLNKTLGELGPSGRDANQTHG